MPEVKQYFSKEDFLEDLAKVTSKIDIKASASLPHYCLQDTEGEQHIAPKFMVMIHIINAIEGGVVINPAKSQTFRRRFMSICWKKELVEAKPAAPAKKAPAKKAPAKKTKAKES